MNTFKFAALLLLGLGSAARAQPLTPGGSSVNLADGGTIGGCTLNGGNITCPGAGTFGSVDGGTELINGPLRVLGITTTASLGVASGAAEVAIAINGTNSGTYRAICMQATAGGSSPGVDCLAWVGGAWTWAATGNISIATGSGNILALNTGAGGGVDMTGSQSVGTCTLDGATPSKCPPVTVGAAFVCTCTVDSVLGAAPCTAHNTAGSAVFYSAAGLTNDVAYHCF